MIVVRGLVKEYRVAPSLSAVARLRFSPRVVRAIDEVDLFVERGEILALMGLNGAGKTTLLRLLSGLLAPTRGEVRVGESTGEALRGRAGYVFADERSFSLRLSVRENLAFFGALHGLSRKAALLRGDGLLERVGLSQHGRREMRELSTGQRQRAAIARGLLSMPEVLLFDEPTRAEDPEGAIALRELIAEEARGRTVLLATHLVEEAEQLCGRVVLLRAGRVEAELPPSEARARIGALP